MSLRDVHKYTRERGNLTLGVGLSGFGTYLLTDAHYVSGGIVTIAGLLVISDDYRDWKRTREQDAPAETLREPQDDI